MVAKSMAQQGLPELLKCSAPLQGKKVASPLSSLPRRKHSRNVLPVTPSPCALLRENPVGLSVFSCPGHTYPARPVPHDVALAGLHWVFLRDGLEMA